MQTNNFKFTFDFGTKPSTLTLEKIEVKVNPDHMVGEFARAYDSELRRRNAVRAQQANLTQEALNDYFTGLLALRIQSIQGDSRYWRQAKNLVIPAWVQFTLSTIGEVIDYDRGLKIVPVMDDYQVDIQQMLDISSVLAAFEGDGVHLLHDAMPRDSVGDVEVMSFALIDDYVMGMTKTAHPISSYVAAFLGFELQKGAAFNALYRVRYDDIEFIKSMLMSTKEVF